jgi:tetratricopeptide (TPR) repeat protein
VAISRRSALQAAEKLVARGRLEAAVKQYRKALAESPDDTGTLNRLGDLYARLNRVNEAVEMFTAAADRFSKEGFFVKAIAIYKKIIRLDPTLIKVYETLADLYHRQGLVNEARSQYQVVADYYKQAGDQPALVAVFEKMVELEPGNPSHRLKLAEFYCSSEQIPQAMEQYQKIAHFMLEHGKVEEAFKVYLGAFELKVDDLGFLTDIIVQLTDLGHEGTAKRMLARAIERNPDASRVAELVDLALPEPPERRGGQPPAKPMASVDVAASKPESLPEPRIAPRLSTEPAEAEAQRADPEELEVVAEAELLEVEPHEVDSTALQDATLSDDETGEFEIALDVLEVAEAGTVEPAVEVESLELIEPESLDGRANELVTEASVLANYGLESKAVELLENALRLAPAHSEAVELLLHLHHQEGQVENVVEVAQRFVDADSLSPRLSALLEDWDYRIVDGKVLSGAATAARPEEVVTEPDVLLPADSRLDWLDEEALVDEDADADSLFGEEDEFFDLAAELEEELLAEEEGAMGQLMPQVEEQSIEEIVAGFKQGVAETLSTDDYDTHYNLGIAYREMGLIDEAIGEFQLAAKSEQYLVDCCSLLGAAFLEKGFPDLAAKWYERGLKAPGVSEEEKLGLLYELGNLYLSTGERQTAKTTFAEIYGANSNYRDIVAKLEELRQK